MPETPPPVVDDKTKPTFEQLEVIVKERNEKNARLQAEKEALAAENAKFREAEQQRIAKEDEHKRTAEQTKLAEQGKFKEALELADKKRDEEVSTTASIYEKKHVPLLIKDALRESKIPVVPTAVADISDALAGKIGFDRKTGEAFIKGENGKPLLDEKMAPVSVQSFLEKYVEDRPHYKADQMVTNASGLKPGAKGAIGDITFTPENALNSRAVAEAWEKADSVAYHKAMKEYSQRGPAKK